MIEAVLWDNDGVLVETEGVFFSVTREAFAAAGLDLPPGTWMRLYLERGLRSRDVALELSLPAAQADALIRGRDEVYRRRLAEGVAVRRGVRRTLAALRGRVRLALVTSSPRRQLLLMHRSTGLLPLFDSVVCREDSLRPKPAPDPYLAALRRLDLTADACLAVEDSARGVTAAAKAGLRCALVPHELTDRRACAGAFRVEPEIAGIARLVEELGVPPEPPAGTGRREEATWKR